MDIKQARELTQKYIDGKCSPTEKAIFESWYNQSISSKSEELAEPDYEALHHRLAQSLPVGLAKKQVLWPRIFTAAVVLLTLSVGVWFFKLRKSATAGKLVQNRQDIGPGKNIAMLTLADGKAITLSEAKKGLIVNSNKLAYDDGSSVITSSFKAADMMVSTPRGGQYQLVLPDGTKVWLNAASSLKFSGNLIAAGERRVILKGEAYFEVFKDKRRPFVVESMGQKVEVLGTHFNVSANPDESAIKTTLIEGCVQVSQEGTKNAKILKPNQQSIITAGLAQIKVEDVDPESVLAWKNGYFMFDDEDLESIMQKVAKWYDVEIQYEQKPVGLTFIGTVSRSRNVSEVLHALERTGKIRFKIEDRRILVLK